jgi:predicted aldo/keto reductase-like oxidoreductase
MTAEDTQKLHQISKEFDKRFCRRCDYCQPCPAGIPIQFVLGLRSMVKRMGPAMMQNPMFSSMLTKAAGCTDCGDCLERCPYDLPIPEMIKANLNWAKEIERIGD